jgi:glutamate N-acetyltransferase/amino-acid N-acetyltransferase
MARSIQSNISERIKDALRRVEGAFSVVAMTRTKLIGVRDPLGVRPLVLGRLQSGDVVLASETCALDMVGATFVREIENGEVVVCSTGLIGELLPMQKIIEGISLLSTELKTDSLEAVARAIMTTDSVPKIANLEISGATFSGVAKGAGMLAPALATMLSVVMTDSILPANAQEIFQRVADRTYNRIDSDGCTSTNDTVLLMGSGASGVTLSADDFEESLMNICGSLAGQLIADAEGSTKTVAINVLGAGSESDAVEVARACARNNLLKCAIFGGDPNWGRVLAAVGTARATMNPTNIDVTLNGVQVARASAPFADRSDVRFDDRLVTIDINLNVGTFHASVMTNDLSHDYVHENSAYAT